LSAYVIIGLIALQRLAELVYAERNTRALKARGAVEIGAGHYPLIVLLHAAWLIAVTVFLPNGHPVNWLLIAVLVILQALRLWVLVTLGPYWTTRIITLPGAPLVREGPYRFVDHPNYLVVMAEIPALPLAFHEWAVAVVFTVLNGAMLAWRIRQENAALAVRRALDSGAKPA
jgi:methyltransferase